MAEATCLQLRRAINGAEPSPRPGLAATLRDTTALSRLQRGRWLQLISMHDARMDGSGCTIQVVT